MITRQMEVWSSEVGEQYTKRHLHSPEQWEQLYIDRFGLTRTEMNSEFIGDLKRDSVILEVGCNVGNQLRVLQNMGFKNLYGIELQWHAVELAKQRTKNINIIQGSALDIPFKDNYFDLVFTSGVLIHFTEEDLPKAMAEIVRCSRKYIWGYEYYEENFTMIPWRGKPDLMWKADYASIYLKHFNNLTLEKQRLLKYKTEDNRDTMFLLEKNAQNQE